LSDFTGGWKKDPWDRKDFKPARIYGEVLPDAYSNFLILAPGRNQELMNSCVGHALRGSVWATAKKSGFPIKDFSPQWYWNGARFIEGTLSQNIGVYPRDAFQWTIESGQLHEEDWPYNGQILDKSAPSSDRMSKAHKYNSCAYYRVDDGIEGIKAALYHKHVIFIGSPWSDKWMNSPKEGILPNVTIDDFNEEGHAVNIYGYDDKAGLFWAQNSWGLDWGIDGKFAFRYEFIDLWKRLGGYDTYYIDFSFGEINNNSGCNKPLSLSKIFKNRAGG